MRGIFKVFVGVVIGGLYGMLFAPKAGKKLRAELQKAENPLKKLFEEGMKMDKEALGTLVEAAKNNEEIQKAVKTGKAKLDEAKKEATKAATSAKKTATKKAKSVKKTATKKVTTAKKAATKKVATAKKAVTKKATTAKKTAPKKATTKKA